MVWPMNWEGEAIGGNSRTGNEEGQSGRFSDSSGVERLFQLGILGSSFFQNGDVGVGVFPEMEEILIRGASFLFVAR